MEIHSGPVRVRVQNKKSLVEGSKNPQLPLSLKTFGAPIHRASRQDLRSLERILLDYRVFIIEGVSGSGKDTFQTFLKKKLGNRDLYDYAEGELLHSWKHFPINGILKIRINFLKLFVNYMRDTLGQDKDAVFLLNRFHLSTYLTTIIRRPELEIEYNEIISVLKTLPVYVFILQLAENQIENRTLHLERSTAWQKLQQQMVNKDGFSDRLERYNYQQKLILETAKKQQIPYSLIRLSLKSTNMKARLQDTGDPRLFYPSVTIDAYNAKVSRKKRAIAQSFREKI